MNIQTHITEIQQELGIEADGLWGPKTNEAYLKWRALGNRRKKKTVVVPMDTPSGLRAFYGTPGDGLVKLTCPYPMVLAWDPSIKIKSFMCHEKVHDSLYNCLQRVLKVCGGVEGVQKARMDLFGGCYNERNRRGGRTLSTHSWGIAIDLDPSRNERGKPWKKDSGMIPMEIVNIFEDSGWTWGGRFSVPDAMHFQLANIR